ncbi:aminotransferase [Dactylosporangium siamense]|uniref:Aminotransferase n=1 Tax=Dactylosporangium siamense TaxID=685454 RepID=A0A919PSS5_9ACTN|nr:aminotransferase [Dactylosporangium siamense]GIG47688.1 hypothetical protein Dsi01nite_057290 [Dactylosporangium siamense]
MKLIRRTLGLPVSPIDAIRELFAEQRSAKAMINLSEGVPAYGPPPVITERLQQAVRNSQTARYAPRAGLPELRNLFAGELSAAYAATVREGEVLITAGCNQAFCVAVSALAAAGDEVILPAPYYFNHEMWLRLDQLTPVLLPTGDTFIPDPVAAGKLITPRTRAILLVTPGNPTGVTVPPAVIRDFAMLAIRHGIALILDETYRNFRPTSEPAHDLYRLPKWQENVITLHSFSKEYAIPGYRVGAMVGHPDLLAEAGKLVECMVVCAPRIGQEAAIAGLRGAREWRTRRVGEAAHRLERFRQLLADAPGGFRLRASGAFFAWVQLPGWPEPAEELVRRLATEQAVLALPGTLFEPIDDRHLRFSVAALADEQFDDLRARLTAFGGSRTKP